LPGGDLENDDDDDGGGDDDATPGILVKAAIGSLRLRASW
jgi:hypothetical protein